MHSKCSNFLMNIGFKIAKLGQKLGNLKNDSSYAVFIVVYKYWKQQGIIFYRYYMKVKFWQNSIINKTRMSLVVTFVVIQNTLFSGTWNF